MLANINTDWDGILHTDKRAHPNATRNVRNVRAVRISNGSIRSAQVTDRVFELAAAAVDPFKMYAGCRRVEVKCLWYGRKPPTTWMHLTIIGTCEVIPNYTGPVVSDFGR